MPLLTTDTEIRALLERARTVAVVGLSDNPLRDSHSVALYLAHRGYAVIPVNPLIRAALGRDAVPDLAHLPAPADIVDVFRRPEHVPAIADAAVAAGARALWLQPGAAHHDAAARAAGAGLDVVVDRCIAAEHRRLVTGRL